MQIVNKEAQLRKHEGFLPAAKLSQMSPAFLQNSWATMENVFCKMIDVYADENWKPLAVAF